MKNTNQPQYNSWIRIRKLLILGIINLTLILILLAINSFILSLLLIIMISIFSYILIIVGGSYYYFTHHNYQNTIHQALVQLVTTNPTRILDIGAGSGSLAIKLAKANNLSKIVAIDYWGEDWEYSQALCERNATIEQVSSIEFIKASASALPFENQSFDLITSCLTFHEVKDTDDIYQVLSESNRVLKINGTYVYLDLFFDPKFYPNLELNLQQVLGTDYQLIKLDKLIDLPILLKHPKVLGHAGVIIGQKRS